MAAASSSSAVHGQPRHDRRDELTHQERLEGLAESVPEE